MIDNGYFRATPRFREFIILDSIHNNKNITQRELCRLCDVAVSLISNHLHFFNKNGLIKKKYLSKKNIEYLITKKGIEYKKVLNIGFLNASLKVYNYAKKNMMIFLSRINKLGFKNIILYGAGEVTEILLQALELDNKFHINVEAVIDDDKNKQDKTLVGKNVLDINEALKISHDGILIASYKNREEMLKNLIRLNYNSNKIINFFGDERK